MFKKQKKNLILADYEGAIIKEAPPAMALVSPHYYFIHKELHLYASIAFYKAISTSRLSFIC